MTTKRVKKAQEPYPPYISYDEIMAKELQNKEFAAAYLSESLRDEKDLTMFLYALRRIIDARGSKMTAVAKKSGLTRESLYKMLSEKGNPKMSSIQAVLDALGFRFQIAG